MGNAAGKTLKLLKVGRKNAILTTTAMNSTISLFILFAASNTTAILPFDFIMNMTCLILMTPYYGHKYYTTLCCPMISCTKHCCPCCCWRVGKTTKGKEKNKEELSKVIDLSDVTKTKTTTASQQVESV